MRLVPGVLVLVMTAATVACGDAQSPVEPSPPPPPGPGAGSLRVMSLEIGGPDSVTPGGTVQLSASARLSDGSTRDVTGDVEWGSHGDKVTVSATGLVTAGLDRGEGAVTAKYTRIPYVHHPGVAWASRQQIVLPAGTYRLYGSVRDDGVLLSGVRVEIVGGSASGMAVTANGFFRFYGVEGDTEIRVSKDGYRTESRRATITGHHTEDFTLALIDSRPSVEGTYTLTIAAASECRASLPADLQRRSYRATVRQDGPRLTITLDTGRFFSQSHTGVANQVFGSVEANRILLSAYGYDNDGTGFYPPSVMEELQAPSHFTFYGQAVIASSANGYSGTWDGALAVVRVLSVYDYQLDAYCQSSGHELLLSR